MEYIYIDETGRFEGERPEPGCFIGGFVGPIEPAAAVGLLRKIVDTLIAEGMFAMGAEPHALHATDLRKEPRAIERVRALAAEAFAKNPRVHLIRCGWFADADIDVSVGADARGFTRYQRMWVTLIRHAAWHAYWSLDEREGLVVHTAQRSFPIAEMARGEHELLRAYESLRMGADNGVRVIGPEQLPQLLRDLLSRKGGRPFERPISAAKVGSGLREVTWAKIDKEPGLAGLLLADLACDLMRAASHNCPELHIPYAPAWSRLEDLFDWSGRSTDALQQLVDLAVGKTYLAGDSELVGLLQTHAAGFVSALAKQPSPLVRAAALTIVRNELAQKEARFPRSELLLGKQGLPELAGDAQDFDEIVQRFVLATHSGRDAAATRSSLRSRLGQLQATQLDATLRHLESVAFLAVSHQDEFEFEDAVEIARPWVERAQRIARECPGAKWTDLGRLLSNYAQSLACRGIQNDLVESVAAMRAARDHLTTSLDLAQWGCHAANVAAVAGDEELRRASWDQLFGAPEVDKGIDYLLGVRLRRGQPLVSLFAATAVTRTAIIGTDAFARALRERLQDRATWQHLVRGIEEADDGHPLERYARHLAELAPRQEGALVDALVRRSVHAFGDLDVSHVAPFQGACTYAAVALARFRQGDAAHAKQLAAEVLPTLRGRFARDDWAAPSALCEVEGNEGGWFLEAVQGLERGADESSLAAFVERFRFEWR